MSLWSLQLQVQDTPTPARPKKDPRCSLSRSALGHRPRLVNSLKGSPSPPWDFLILTVVVAMRVKSIILFLPSSPFLIWLSFGDWLMGVERGGAGVRTSLSWWFQEGMELSRLSDSSGNSRGDLAGRWGRSAVLILLRA